MLMYAQKPKNQTQKPTVQKKETKKEISLGNLETSSKNPYSFSFAEVSEHYKSDKPAQLQIHSNTQGNQGYIGSKRELNNNESLQMKARDKVMQLLKVEETFTAVADGKKGNDSRAYSDIFGTPKGSPVGGNSVTGASGALQKLGFTDNVCIGAHMLPKKLGGKGGLSFGNVKPWLQSFETNTWNPVMEDDLNKNIREIKVADELKYTVETTDMTDTEAENVVENMKPGESTENKNKWTKGINPIPKKVLGEWEIKGHISKTGRIDSTGCTPITEYERKPKE